VTESALDHPRRPQPAELHHTSALSPCCTGFMSSRLNKPSHHRAWLLERRWPSSWIGYLFVSIILSPSPRLQLQKYIPLYARKRPTHQRDHLLAIV
jgi:hypothetical protein